MSLQPPALLSRRKVVGGSAFAVFGSALPLSSTRADDRYARFRGQTVAFCIPDHPHYDVMQKLLPQFTADTGIKVELARENILRMKHVQLAEMAKPQSSFDLVTYIVTWKGEYVKKKLITPLEPFFKDARLADPDYAMGDLVPRYLQNIGLVGGPKGYLPGPGARLYGLPFGAETSVLAYRRDVFEKHGFVAPRTYTGLARLLQPLREKTGMAALTSRGQAGHNCVHAWLLHLNALGGGCLTTGGCPASTRRPACRRWSCPSKLRIPAPKAWRNSPTTTCWRAFCRARARCIWIPRPCLARCAVRPCPRWKAR